MVLCATIAAALLVGCQSEPPLDVFGQAPEFALTDQRNASFASADLRGRATLVDFIYTHCTDACPTLSATMSQVQKKLDGDKLLGSRVVLVSLTVDPMHDTPAVLAEYGAQFGANPEAWKLLTGDWDRMYDVIAGFKVGTRAPRPALDAPPPAGDEISHTTRVVLVDGQQQVRAYLPGDQASPDEIVQTVKRVLR